MHMASTKVEWTLGSIWHWSAYRNIAHTFNFARHLEMELQQDSMQANDAHRQKNKAQVMHYSRRLKWDNTPCDAACKEIIFYNGEQSGAGEVLMVLGIVLGAIFYVLIVTAILVTDAQFPEANVSCLSYTIFHFIPAFFFPLWLILPCCIPRSLRKRMCSRSRLSSTSAQGETKHTALPWSLAFQLLKPLIMNTSAITAYCSIDYTDWSDYDSQDQFMQHPQSWYHTLWNHECIFEARITRLSSLILCV